MNMLLADYYIPYLASFASENATELGPRSKRSKLVSNDDGEHNREDGHFGSW